MGILTTIILLGGLLLSVIVVVIGIVLYVRTYDYKVRIRELTGSNVRLIHDTTGKLKQDKDNISYLRLFVKKGIHEFLPVPPEEAIDYDPKKRKKIVEVWYSDESGYVFVKDSNKIEGLEPFPTNQRILYTNQIRKKELNKKVPWTQYLPFIASGLVLVIVVAIMLIFWGQAVQPMIDIGEKYNGLLDKTDKILEKATLLSGGGQVISQGITPPT